MTGGEGWRERFSRQTLLSVLGEDGQRAIEGTSVAVVGAGGLGSASAEMLVRMGFGRVRVVDGDVVELSNLHRVRLYGVADVGRRKVDVLAERLTGLFPGSRVEVLPEDVGPGNALDLLGGADLVLDGLDSMPGRYVVNDACLELGVPWVYGGVVATGGLVAPFTPGGPCLRCLFPNVASEDRLPTTDTVGIHPALPAAVASIQVALASRLAVGDLGTPSMIALDLWSDDLRVIGLRRRPDCPACGRGLREHLSGVGGP